MNYDIRIDKPARKFIERQPKDQQARILKAIANLPAIGDIKPLQGQPEVYRLRVGSYRIIYTIQEELVILVMNIGNRGDIYK